MTMLRSFIAGQFQFTIDGTPDTAYIKSVDGGNAKAEVVSDQVGPDYTTFKSAATVGYEPISVELGMAASKGIIEWISDSWRRDYSRRSGSIRHADYSGKVRFEQSFTNAIIAETVFPKLDANDKSPAYMTVKLQPEEIKMIKASGNLQGTVTTKQMMWTPSSFTFHIDGMNCDGISSIDSFTVKQKHKALYVGSHRFPEIEPTGLEFPNISLTMSAAFAGDFIKWHEQVVIKGKKDTRAEKDGELIFYDQAMANPLITVQFQKMGIFNLSFEKAEAQGDNIKRVKVELYCEGMSITQGFGLE